MICTNFLSLLIYRVLYSTWPISLSLIYLLVKNKIGLNLKFSFLITSSLSYLDSFYILQATLPGFLSRGLSAEEGELLLKKSVTLAVEARNRFWDAVERNPVHRYNRALVAASIGSYGAYLADGSEYRCLKKYLFL